MNSLVIAWTNNSKKTNIYYINNKTDNIFEFKKIVKNNDYLALSLSSINDNKH